MTITSFIEEAIKGREPGCCMLDMLADLNSGTASLVLHTKHSGPWPYQPTESGDVYNLARTELEKRGWRVFYNMYNWENYCVGRCPRLPATRAEIEEAREQYAMGSDDDIEIDSDAMFSESDNGYWVQAWVYVANEEEEEEDDASAR